MLEKKPQKPEENESVMAGAAMQTGQTPDGYRKMYFGKKRVPFYKCLTQSGETQSRKQPRTGYEKYWAA